MIKWIKNLFGNNEEPFTGNSLTLNVSEVVHCWEEFQKDVGSSNAYIMTAQAFGCTEADVANCLEIERVRLLNESQG